MFENKEFTVICDSDDDNANPSDIRYPSKSKKQKNRDNLLTQWVVDTCTPFSRVDHASFKQLCQRLDPKWTVPSAKRISSQSIPEMVSNTMNSDILPALKFASAIAITTDTWKAKSRMKYTTINVHMVSKSCQMLSFNIQTLPIGDKHTGDAIASYLRRSLESLFSGLCGKVWRG